MKLHNIYKPFPQRSLKTTLNGVKTSQRVSINEFYKKHKVSLLSDNVWIKIQSARHILSIYIIYLEYSLVVFRFFKQRVIQEALYQISYLCIFG